MQAIAPVSILIVSRWGPSQPPAFKAFVLNAIPYSILLVAAFVVSVSARQRIQSGTIDLVRLTPQRAEAIALEWYVGAALPFWTATILACAALAVLVLPDPAVGFFWLLPALAVAVPAISLAEGMQYRAPGAYLLLPCLVLLVLDLDSYLLLDAAPPPRSSAFEDPSYIHHQRVFLTACAAALSIGVTAGRLRRAAGPPLAGCAAIAGIVAVALGVRSFPIGFFPRVFPALLAVLGSFAAEERDVPTGPTLRLVIAGSAALLAGLVVGRAEGVAWGAWGANLATGTAAALAGCTAILVHELAWRRPAISLGVRLIMLGALVGLSWRMVRMIANDSYEPLRVPLLVQPADLVALAAAFAAAAVLHLRARTRSGTVSA